MCVRGRWGGGVRVGGGDDGWGVGALFQKMSGAICFKANKVCPGQGFFQTDTTPTASKLIRLTCENRPLNCLLIFIDPATARRVFV